MTHDPSRGSFRARPEPFEMGTTMPRTSSLTASPLRHGSSSEALGKADHGERRLPKRQRALDGLCPACTALGLCRPDPSGFTWQGKPCFLPQPKHPVKEHKRILAQNPRIGNKNQPAPPNPTTEVGGMRRGRLFTFLHCVRIGPSPLPWGKVSLATTLVAKLTSGSSPRPWGKGSTLPRLCCALVRNAFAQLCPSLPRLATPLLCLASPVLCCAGPRPAPPLLCCALLCHCCALPGHAMPLQGLAPPRFAFALLSRAKLCHCWAVRYFATPLLCLAAQYHAFALLGCAMPCHCWAAHCMASLCLRHARLGSTLPCYARFSQEFVSIHAPAKGATTLPCYASIQENRPLPEFRQQPIPRRAP